MINTKTYYSHWYNLFSQKEKGRVLVKRTENKI